MSIMWIYLLFTITARAGGQNWQTLKRYTFSNMQTVRNDWFIETRPAGWWNNEWQEYIDSPSTIFTRDNRLVIRAYRQNRTFYSGRLRSKQLFTPTDSDGKKLRVEFTAKVPTKSGAWPALWMFGDEDAIYGSSAHAGEIDVMEWAHQIGDKIETSLHWKSTNGFAYDFHINRSEVSSNFLTYGVEYSNRAGDEYVHFYVIRADGDFIWGPKQSKDTWIWDNFPPCRYEYTAEAARCSYLAPFDNRMIVTMNLAVGGDWGNCCGVQPSDYRAFDDGIEMEISSVIVFHNTVLIH